jgi:hypothetical protein
LQHRDDRLRPPGFLDDVGRNNVNAADNNDDAKKHGGNQSVAKKREHRITRQI